jgi:secreted trypsin-like serine protease
MRHLKLLVAALLLAPTLATASPKIILNGQKVTDEKQFPFVVAIYTTNGDSANCTGSVIGDYWVLTAQHCVLDYSSDNDYDPIKMMKPKELQVGTGIGAAKKAAAKKVIDVKSIYIYGNQIDPSLTRDVALLELKKPAGVTPVALPESYDVFPEIRSGNQKAAAVGFGFVNLKFSPKCATNPDNPEKCQMVDATYDKYLHYGAEILQSDQAAMARMAKIIKMFPEMDDGSLKFNPVTMIGGMGKQGNVATNGDSGGPLLISVTTNNEKRFVQIGVVSWGLPAPGSYKAYKIMKDSIDFYAYLAEPVTLDFIKTTMKKHG